MKNITSTKYYYLVRRISQTWRKGNRITINESELRSQLPSGTTSPGTPHWTMATTSKADGAVNDATVVAPTASTTISSNGHAHQHATKKKFGKNLNKLTAPPTAPDPKGGTKTNASAKNGLLLLSNKHRPSSGTNAAATASANTSNPSGGVASGGGVGILSTKTTLSSSKPLPNLGLHIEFNPSTHDALMGVVVGASRMESQHQPDAWGVAEKHHASVVDSVDLAAPKVEKERESIPDQPTSDKDPSASRDHHWQRDYEESHEPGEFRSSNWDEYGGRNIPGDTEEKTGETSIDNGATNDDQVAYMSNLAKERAERRKVDEETRLLQQKERAAQKLRELEDKMESNKQAAAPEIFLDGAMASNLGQDYVSGTSPRERSSPRKLFDPNEPSKSYSSSLRGGTTSLQTDLGHHQQRSRKNATNETPSDESNAFQRNQEVIQLVSYDATDRGTRSADTGPRMLFDPKSGSMIEVSSRDDASDKKKKKGRLKKKKTSGEEGMEDLRMESKVRNTHKNDGTGQVRGRGIAEPSIKQRRDTRKGKISVSRKLPRTCGVLFWRDNHGSIASSDKCDGDLGYGVHSVPGGKVKNPEAYSSYLQIQKQLKSRSGSRHEKLADSKGSPKSSADQDIVLESSKQPALDWVKPNEKIELITGVEESPTLQATAREWAPSSKPSYSIAEQNPHGVSTVGSIDDHDEDEEDEDEPVSQAGMLQRFFIIFLDRLLITSFFAFSLDLDLTLL